MFSLSAGAEEYGYTRQCFYCKPYIFDIRWNISDKTAKSLESAEISLSDETSVTIRYDKALKADMSDTDVTAALGKILSSLGDNYPGLENPVVIDIKDTGDSTPGELAEEYYNDGNIAYYGAVLPFADGKTRRTCLKRAYDDDNAGYFSVSLDAADSAALTSQYLDKAYRDGNTGIFAICLGCQAAPADIAEITETYLDKAYEDGNAAFFSICHNCLKNSMSADDFDGLESTYAERACRDERYDYAAICGCDYIYESHNSHHEGGHHRRSGHCGEKWE